MPLLRNKYQPYIPDPDSPSAITCGAESYCHPVSLGDHIKTQFYQTPCAANQITDPDFADYSLGAELLTNGTFTGSAAGWTAAGGPLPGGGWAYGTNNIVHTPGSTDAVGQTGIAMTTGNTYQIVIDIVRTAGDIYVQLGDSIGSTASIQYDTTGTYTFNMLFLDNVDFSLAIVPSSDFDGTIESVSLKEVTFTNWDVNASWTISDGYACHIDGTTGLLTETVATYIDAGSYWKITVDVSGYVAGTCDVYMSDSLVGTISANGQFTYWTDTRPTIAGVVSFDPSSDFIGCISLPDARELRDDYSGDLINADTGDAYDLSPYFTYYQDWVTLDFQIGLFEVGYDCYYYTVYDSCLISGDELVTNGDFATGDFTGWTRNNGTYQFNINGSNQLEFIFDPLTGETDLVTNGDFATGDFTGWTAGANWAVVGNKAQHTAGSTDTFYQTIVIAAPPAPPTPEQYWVQFVVSNRTAGSIRATWGNAIGALFSADGTYTIPLTPGTSGSVDLIFTPTSTFDGDIDDIVLVASNTVWSASPFITNQVNTDMVAGNYSAGYDIIANPITTNKVGIQLLGMTQSVNYETAVGTYVDSITNYVPGSQQVRILASFRDGSNFVPGTITIDNITAYRVEPFDATYTSECLNYRLEHENTRMLVGYCDQESFGFEFANTGFTLQQRVLCRSFNPSYPSGVGIMKSGNGNGRVTYAELEKYWLFVTDYLSETAHDALAVIRLCDHYLIGTAEDNGTEYLIDTEEYAPQWRAEGDYSLATSTQLLRIKADGQKFNRHT